MPEPTFQVFSVATLLDIEWIVPEPSLKRQIGTEKISYSHLMAMIGYRSLNRVSQRDNHFRVWGIGQQSLRNICVNEIGRRDFS